MAFTIPSMAETREFVVALFKFLFNDRNVGSRRSYHGKRATFLSGAITQLHRHIKSVQDDVMPDTAGDDGPIDRWGSIFQVARKPATAARGSQALRVYGTAGSTATVGELLTHQASSLVFRLASPVTIPGSAPFYVDVDVEAVDVGALTRLLEGEILEFQAPPAGIQTNAVLQKDLDEDGFDAEQFGAYRGRVLDTIGLPAAGGTAADYVKWALEVTGIAKAFCYPNRAGLGTVDVVGLKLGSGSVRYLTLGERSDLEDYLRTKAPAHLAGEGGALRVLETIGDSQDVDITIQTNGQAAYAFDWEDSLGYTVTAWNAGTRTLSWSALPPTLAAGHRIILKGVASSQDGRQYVVEAISGTDTILETVPPNAPAATDVIYSGGPLVDPIRDAILAHMNGDDVYLAPGSVPTGEQDLSSAVGLEVLAEGIGPANPDGKYGTWIGGIIRGVLGKIAIAKSGVRNYTIVTPSADHEADDPAYPDDAQIDIIEPGAVIVRKAS